MGLLGRIISIIITTFVLAAVYGLLCVTVDVLDNHRDPVASGRHAADTIYGLFGTVSEEVKHTDEAASPRLPSIGHRIAAPYAVTADVSAILGGKLEVGISSLFHSAEVKSENAPAH